jgi:DNA-binding XRE family transcriptional regulator
VSPGRALLQLRIIRSVLRTARQQGAASPELLARSQELAEQTAIAIEGEPDAEFLELLASIRSDIARGS